jgi:ABC-type multidrug transport system fused ATPase/permease subunit
VTNDTDTLGEVFVSEVMNAFSNILTLIGVVLMMFLMNVELALVSLTVIPLIVLSVKLFHPIFRSAYEKVQRRIAKVTSRLEENVSGIREIQSFAQETDALRNFEKANRKDKEARLQAAKIFGTFYPISTFISQVGRVIVLIYGGYLLVQGEITIGILVAFLAYLSRFFEPIATLTTLYNTIQSALAASERIFEIIDTKPEVKDKPEAKDLAKIRGEIVFQNVTFGYNPSNPVFQDLSFKVKSKETVAIVGLTGVGKSTIIKLLSRFYEHQSGTITIDGIDIKDIKLKSLRSHIGIVQQESTLFSGNIMENIRYGKLDASEEEIKKAAQLVGAHEFIEKLPDEYKTWVGEQGIKLSAGQRQLISFARALVNNPPILLLDEATSNIDPYTEFKIKEAQSILLKNRASLVIAHRLSTVVNADKIIVLDKGKIVEEGSHGELVKKKGLYQHLYQMQFKNIEESLTAKIS